MSALPETLSGHCLCESVRFSVKTPTHLDACHCDQCRRWSGSLNMSLDFTEVTFEQHESLKWFQSSDWAERGFCGTCGSSLFYRLIGSPQTLTVCVGALDHLPASIPLTKEFFIDKKPAFYALEGERDRLTGAEVFALYGVEEES